MPPPLPSQLELLNAMRELQSQQNRWLIESDRLKNAGNLPAAAAAYRQLIQSLNRLLDITSLYNEQYARQNPMELGLIVRGLSNALLTCADVLEALGQLPDADAQRQQALDLSRRYLSKLGIAETERQRATALASLGRFNEALDALSNARDQLEKGGQPIDQALVTINLANILEWLEDWPRAREQAEYAANLVAPWLAQEGIREVDIAQAMQVGEWAKAQELARLSQIVSELTGVLARVKRQTGDLDGAERLFRRALTDVPKEARPAVEAQLAAIVVARGRYPEGLALVDRLIPRFKGLLRPKLGVLLRLRADALFGLGRLEQALSAVDDAIQDLSQYYDPDSLWKMQWLRVRILQALHRPPAQAMAAYQEATGTIHRLRRSPLGYRLDSTYLKNKLPVYAGAIELAAGIGDAESACCLMEMIKSRILTATLSLPVVPSQGAANEQERWADALSLEISRCEYAAYQEGWTSERRQRHDALLAERAAVLERLRISDPRWRSLTEPVPFVLDRVQSVLNSRRQAVLNLYYQPGKVIAVLLQSRRSSVRTLHLAAEAMARLDSYLQNLQAEPERWNARWFDLSGGLGVQADQFIPAELLDQAVRSDSLVIIPHGCLHLVPWAGLYFRGRRLFEHCPTGILPNLSCVLSLQVSLSAHPRAALIGAPGNGRLPGLKPLFLAPEELETLAQIYSTRGGLAAPTAVAQDATRSRFRELMTSSNSIGSILHIACHGRFDTEDPMNSGLILGDGNYSAAEIARLPLQYEEVVLSACSTGRRPTSVQGITLAGDDILGLPGAFLEAGARSILVSIPPADDRATLAFMTRYHENRADGVAPLTALQQAQKAMLDDKTYPAHLWIGFTVYGCQ